jgi:DNA-binding response OmpR family regulator
MASDTLRPASDAPILTAESGSTSAVLPLNVLWIEDHPNEIAPLKRALEAAGCHVEVVERGIAGLERALQRIHDVIILDWKLPDLSGGAILEKIRRDGLNVPVVVLTGHGNEDVKLLSRLLGGAIYRTKPIRPRNLLATLVSAAGDNRRSLSATPERESGANRTGVFVSSAIRRFAQAIVDGVSLAEDPRTFADWAKLPGVTEDSLHRLCRLLALDGRAALRFTRLLRAVTLVEQHGFRLTEALAVAEPRTVVRLLASAGFGNRAPSTVAEFLSRQQLLRHEALLKAVCSALSRPRGN